MPVPDPLRAELGVLRTDDPGELLGEHLLHHHRPGRGRERQQPFTHRRRDIGHRHRRFQPQAGQLAGGVRGRDLHDRYLLGHGDPSPCWVSWSIPETCQHGTARGRDHQLTSTSSGTTSGGSWRAQAPCGERLVGSAPGGVTGSGRRPHGLRRANLQVAT
jgi:hypothetical protein